MIKQICITDTRGPRFFTHADFPLSVGSHPGAEIHVSSPIQLKSAASLFIIVNRVYIEPQSRKVKILINDDAVEGQKEIQHDDILQIEDSTFHCEHIGDTLSISLYDDQAHVVLNEEDIVEHGEVIEPISIPQVTTESSASKKIVRIVSLTTFLLLSLLGLILVYIFTAKSLLIEIEPKPDSIALSGKIWPVHVQGRYLVQPGKYHLEVTKDGYHPLVKEIKVTKSQSQIQSYTLKKKPGFLFISSNPENGVEILIDGKRLGTTPMEEFELNAGSYSLQAFANRYQEFSTQIVIEGKDQKQELNIELLPNWSEVSINSKPEGAEIWLDGNKKGVTPFAIELLAGRYSLELLHDDYIPYATEFSVIANEALNLPTAELFTSASHLVITSTPPKAVVSIGTEEKGITPLTIKLNPNTEHTITLSKAGFRTNQHQISLKPGEQNSLTTTLEAILGSVILNVDPADSEVFVNGKFAGKGQVKLSLPSAPHRLEIRKSGYEVFEKMVSPTPNTPQILDIVLNRITSATSVNQPESIRSSQGHELRLIVGGKFSMGAGRREQGSRSNETLHTVELQRPFYISTAEVTNAQFAAFQAIHNSGSYKGNDLSAPSLPVANVSWEDAARYCNWLSDKDGLEKVYAEVNGVLIAKDPLPVGYRLPTESEWEWVARIQNDGTATKYEWGDEFPPTQVTGNYADSSASDIIETTISNHDDGYIIAAPIGSFKPNRFGLYDLGGNVAEWCHDYHSVYPSISDEVFIDPLGPTSGDKHVIRGASWKRGDLSSTRLSYRDRDNKKRIDVGFRIAKYID